MVVNEALDDFLNEFNKKFKNFCEKTPIILTYKTTPNSVYLYEYKSKEVKKFDFDFSISVKRNIKNIKDWLVENKYPIMIQVEVSEGDYSPEEAQKLIDEGMEVEEALTSKKTEERVTKWRIEKLIVKRDELFVRNITTNKYYRYKMTMPSTVFLKRLREKYSEFESYDIFTEKSILLNEIYDNYEDNHDQNRMDTTKAN